METKYPSPVQIADDLIDNYPDLFKNVPQTKILIIDALGQYFSDMTAYLANKEKKMLEGIRNNGKGIFDAIIEITRDYEESISKSKTTY